jgi:hypothetical protein
VEEARLCAGVKADSRAGAVSIFNYHRTKNTGTPDIVDIYNNGYS